jgi:hypothetical protein
MSRSKKGSKGAGYDYWSRRYGNESGCNSPTRNKLTKKVTNRAERRIARQETKKNEE